MSNRRSSNRGKRSKNKASRRQAGCVVGKDMPELQQARAHWISNRFPQALDLFAKAVRKEPNNALALVDASRAFGARFEFARAERFLERLIDCGGRRADVLQMAGQSYRMIQRPQLAIACLEKALDASPDLYEARLELALLYERRHDLDKAAEQVDAALAKNPRSPEARFLSGRVARRRGDASFAEQTLRDVASDESVHWITASQAWHELGQLYDESGEFEQAYQAVCHGKKLLEAEAKPVRRRAEIEARGIEHLHSELTPEHFARWRDDADRAGLPRQQMALLTGPPRSGTTLLEKVLDGHSEIITSDEQEAFPKFILPALLSKRGEDKLLHVGELDEAPKQRLLSERERYLRYLADALGSPLGDRVLIDKNPSIVMLIPGMLRLFPECKLLIALRDPRDVVVSCFMRYLPLNTVSVQFLSLQGAAERFSRDMQAWLRLRDMIGPQWLEVRYEDTVQDLERQARNTLGFLGVEWEQGVLSYRDRLKNRQVNSPTYESVAKPVYSSATGRWKNYEAHLGPALEVVQPLLAKLDYT